MPLPDESERWPELTTSKTAILFKLTSWVPDADEILPRIGYGFRPHLSSGDLYDGARAWWVLSPEAGSEHVHAVAVFAGITRGAWTIDHSRWRSIKGEDARRYGRAATRWAFEGSPVAPECAAELVGRRIPSERPEGGAVFGNGAVVAYWPRRR